MKNNKSSRSAPSKASGRPPFRSSAAGAKSRDGEGGKGKKPFYKDIGEKPGFGKRTKFGGAKFSDKPKFGDKPKPSFRKPKPETRETIRVSEGGVLIWGLHAARAAFLNPKRRVTRLWLTEAGQKTFEATQNEAREELLKRPDAKRLDREELDKIIPTGSVHQGIVIETAALHEPTLHDIIGADPPPDLILMLDQVTDPHNVGAILRSAAAFGAGAIVMTERNAPTTTGVLAKSASGALEYTPMIHVVNLARAIDDLREAGYWCVGLAEEGAKTLGEMDLSGRTVLVLGAEGDGLRHLTRQKCDELARLPTGGAIGSLNVSNAAAVALYEVRRQAK
jgi:23S rRNA (guanosine2251-2'-O)-methyltransferase